MDANASINGTPLPIEIGAKDGRHLLVLDPSGALPGGDAPIELHVTLKDRAGNMAVLDRQFRSMIYRQDIVTGTLNCSVNGQLKPFHPPVSGEWTFGFRNGVHPVVARSEEMTGELILDLPYIGGAPLPKALRDSIVLTSEHPKVVIHRRDEGDEQRLRFVIEQTGPVPPSDATVFLTLMLPDSVSFTHAYDCRNGRPAVVDTQWMPKGLRRHLVPFFLRPTWTSGIRITQKGNRLDCRVSARADDVVDHTVSFFSAGAVSKWIRPVGGGEYEASIQVNEGRVPFAVELASAFGRWEDGDPDAMTIADGTRRRYEGEWRVAMGKPEIVNFRYDPDAGRFTALIEDEGTPIEDLSVAIDTMEGHLQCRIDPASGVFVSPLVFPSQATSPATLSVTDLADQTSQSVAYWGRPPTQNAVGPTVTAFETHTRKRSQKHWRRDIRSLSETIASDGTSLVEVCRHHLLPPLPPWEAHVRRCKEWVAKGGCLRMGCDASDCLKPTGTTLTVQKCDQELLDISPPVIESLTCGPDGSVSAKIHDHGAPLEDLVVDASVKRFKFDRRTGRFTASVRLGEKETQGFRIYARDASGNDTTAYLELVVPSSPPDVTLKIDELKKAGQRVSYNGFEVDALITATAKDESGIDHRLNRPAIDGIRVPVLGVMDVFDGAEDTIVFGGQRLSEGAHVGEISVTDRVGLSATARMPFTIDPSPKIEGFRFLHPPDPTLPVPVLTARILDPGNDLHSKNIVVCIDGIPLPEGHVFYHPDSGYAAVDGPVPLSPGSHEATITAVDDRGHSAQAHLSFVWGGIDITAPEDEDADVILADTEIWEIRTVDNDGLINPGEGIRLFFRLQNQGGKDLSDVVAEMRSLDPRLRVETPELFIGKLVAGASLRPADGFDLYVSAGVEEEERFNPTPLSIRLELTDSSGERRVFPMDLPIYEARGKNRSAGDIQLTLDRLDRTTLSPWVELGGEASTPERDALTITLRVNDERVAADWSRSQGRYRALADLKPGDNTIDVQAVASGGRRARVDGVVHRLSPYTAPSLSIDAPKEGEWIDGCRPLEIKGRCDGGSDTIEHIAIEFTALDSGGSLPTVLPVVDHGIYRGEIPPGMIEGACEIKVQLRTLSGETVTAVRRVQLSGCS
jgi:hypothetical protein